MPEHHDTEVGSAEWLVDAVLDGCPDYQGLYPIYTVVGEFRRFVRGRLDDQADQAELRSYFGWVEDMIARDISEVDDLMWIEFIDSATWRVAGADDLMGPGAKALLNREQKSRPRWRAMAAKPPMRIRKWTAFHRELVHRFPAFGSEADVLDGVLFSFDQWLMQPQDTSSEIVARAEAYVEELLGQANEDVRERALRSIFMWRGRAPRPQAR
jgi:hypothetical protein